MTEFNAGSDIFSMELRLHERNNTLIAKGKKLFITNGMIADFIVLYGRMDNGQLAAVVVDTEHQKLKNFSLLPNVIVVSVLSQSIISGSRSGSKWPMDLITPWNDNDDILYFLFSKY